MREEAEEDNFVSILNALQKELLRVNEKKKADDSNQNVGFQTKLFRNQKKNILEINEPLNYNNSSPSMTPTETLADQITKVCFIQLLMGQIISSLRWFVQRRPGC